MTPGEALARLFLDNADHSRNAANDELIAALRQRARQIRSLADLAPPAGQSTSPKQGRDPTVITTVSIPAAELISIEPMASVNTVIWGCRICDQHGTATTRPFAHAEGVDHLTAEHHATTAATG